MNYRTKCTALFVAALTGTSALAVTISDIPDQCVEQGGTLGPIPFTIQDDLLLSEFLGVIALSSNQALIPDANISRGGTGSQRTLTLSPVAGALGTATIEVTVFAPPHLPATDYFVVQVVPANAVSLQCPEPIEVTADAETCSAVVEFAPSFESGCGTEAVVCDPPSGSAFALGTTEVTCAVGELGAGGLACNFPVSVYPPTAVALVCPMDQVIDLEPGRSTLPVSFEATVDGACGNVTPECVPPSGSDFAAGVTLVDCAVSDASGQTAACQFSITVHAAPPATFVCPLGKGYWRTHLSAWPVRQLTLGSQLYPQDILNALLRTSVRGDASLLLASELIPALLNLADSADFKPVAGAIETAQQLLAGCVGPLPCQVPPSSVVGKRMLSVAAELEAFNTGQLTPDCQP